METNKDLQNAGEKEKSQNMGYPNTDSPNSNPQLSPGEEDSLPSDGPVSKSKMSGATDLNETSRKQDDV